ncbi:uncharacterized protein LOC135202082 [Macrobrachium nipponense]|uniref:uncharacterized protein LOC135202082 n=1 Tax=Macrobrachium nipponense TaxID=159736 RepID=UPI0030C80681
MMKMTYSLVAVVLATAAMAAEQHAPEQDSWLPSFPKARPARSLHNKDWVAHAWQPEANPLTPSTHQRWSADEDVRDVAWEVQDPLGAALQFEHGNLDEDLANSEESMLEIVRQPPSRLGSLVDLYKDVFHGLSPFVANPENQILPAKPERRSGLSSLEGIPENQILPAKPERRSGRRPAACRFGPFGLVCWNAARRGAVMRQRSTQYSQ